MVVVCGTVHSNHTGLQGLDEKGIEIATQMKVNGGVLEGGGGGGAEGVVLQRLRTALQNMQLSPQNSFGE